MSSDHAIEECADPFRCATDHLSQPSTRASMDAAMRRIGQHLAEQREALVLRVLTGPPLWVEAELRALRRR